MHLQLPICLYKINKHKVRKTKKKSERNTLERRMTRESVGIYITTLTLQCVYIRIMLMYVYVYSYEATKKRNRIP